MGGVALAILFLIENDLKEQKYNQEYNPPYPPPIPLWPLMSLAAPKSYLIGWKIIFLCEYQNVGKMRVPDTKYAVNNFVLCVLTEFPYFVQENWF